MHARELCKRHGKTVVATSCHPGSFMSNITRHMFPLICRRLGSPVERAVTGQIDVWYGLQTPLYCLISPSIEPGAYYSQHGSPRGTIGGWPVAPSGTQATDDALCSALWDESERILDVSKGQQGNAIVK